MDARTLYRKSREMRAFVGVWIKEKHCPMPLVDFLLENGLESQAECARWCATEPKRQNTDTGKFHGVFPWRMHKRTYVFDIKYHDLIFHDDVSVKNVSVTSEDYGYVRAGSVALCILRLLDAWKV